MNLHNWTDFLCNKKKCEYKESLNWDDRDIKEIRSIFKDLLFKLNLIFVCERKILFE